MKPKEIHDLLLSLLCRGLGFWLLYIFFADNFPTAFRLFIYENWQELQGALGYALPQLGAAIYLIVGAPPLLKWATRNRN